MPLASGCLIESSHFHFSLQRVLCNKSSEQGQLAPNLGVKRLSEQFLCVFANCPQACLCIDIGIKSAGHVTSPGRVNIQMNRPEGHQAKVTTSVFLRRSIICHARPGVAVHSSTVFVADTQNHRIIMVRSLDRCVVQSVNVVFSSQKIDKNSTLHAHWSGNSFLEGANP